MEAIKSGVAKKVLISALSPMKTILAKSSSGPLCYATVGQDTSPPGKRARHRHARYTNCFDEHTTALSHMSMSRSEAVLECVPSKPRTHSCDVFDLWSPYSQAVLKCTSVDGSNFLGLRDKGRVRVLGKRRYLDQCSDQSQQRLLFRSLSVTQEVA